jgi:hypothetical protein
MRSRTLLRLRSSLKSVAGPASVRIAMWNDMATPYDFQRTNFLDELRSSA